MEGKITIELEPKEFTFLACLVGYCIYPPRGVDFPFHNTEGDRNVYTDIYDKMMRTFADNVVGDRYGGEGFGG